MTDKRIKEPCPFCGEKAENIQIKHFKDGWNKIYCPTCCVTFEGVENKQTVIDKWNNRYH